MNNFNNWVFTRRNNKGLGQMRPSRRSRYPLEKLFTWFDAFMFHTVLGTVSTGQQIRQLFGNLFHLLDLPFKAWTIYVEIDWLALL